MCSGKKLFWNFKKQLKLKKLLNMYLKLLKNTWEGISLKAFSKSFAYISRSSIFQNTFE